MHETLIHETETVPSTEAQYEVPGDYEIDTESWDYELFALVQANANTLVNLPEMGGAQMTLSEATKYIPINEQNVQEVVDKVRALLTYQPEQTPQPIIEEKEPEAKDEETEVIEHEEQDKPIVAKDKSPETEVKNHQEDIQNLTETIKTAQEPTKEDKTTNEVLESSKNNRPNNEAEKIADARTSNEPVADVKTAASSEGSKPGEQVSDTVEVEVVQAEVGADSSRDSAHIDRSTVFSEIPAVEANKQENPEKQEVSGKGSSTVPKAETVSKVIPEVGLKTEPEPEEQSTDIQQNKEVSIDVESAPVTEDEVRLENDIPQVELEIDTNDDTFTDAVENEIEYAEPSTLEDEYETLSESYEEAEGVYEIVATQEATTIPGSATEDVFENGVDVDAAAKEILVEYSATELQPSKEFEALEPAEIIHNSLPISQIEDSIAELTKIIDDNVPETIETVNEYLYKISEASIKLKQSGKDEVTHKEDGVQEDIEGLFAELFDQLGISYTSEMVESLARLTLRTNMIGSIQEIKTPESDDNIDQVPQDTGTHESISQILIGVGTLGKIMEYASDIGRSAIRLCFSFESHY